MIKGFRNKETEILFRSNGRSRFPPDIVPRARRKLLVLDAAFKLADVTVPPSNRLELLSGNRQGQHSIRINDQWRICFVWDNGHAHEVEICDYH
ncbi:type II toxin-antitoxin system RelE/ParE family toxin [Rhizobium sp. 32-5/1]|uniref:type II toxin-antitoxin system RelE/ParE family toxin n=1 Tax=Rhizobium sp. 32-5/1 TaxID=3019602 RepID=UPI00240E482E|nr:type II toxin-antitoxin system RelE/ParE family toxin [Rhizobium sp. 32-5/1]WEZ83631.1 type II toxin-antitoxin system RelE/ParE family toxin [Rhizobium sp. 32-5/1]